MLWKRKATSGKAFREGLWLYKARLSNTPGLDFDAEQEFPFLLTEAVLIVLLLLAAYLGKRAALLWQLLLWRGEKCLWMYLILRNRVPVRISHPLYFAEIVMLAAWLLHYLKDGQFTAKEKLSARRWLNPVYVSAVLLFVTAISLFPRSMEKTGEEYASREGSTGPIRQPGRITAVIRRFSILQTCIPRCSFRKRCSGMEKHFWVIMIFWAAGCARALWLRKAGSVRLCLFGGCPC